MSFLERCRRCRPYAKTTIVVLATVLLAIQLIPVDRGNPPIETEVPATAEARAILRRACYDCHSNETVWPWYGRIAPVSWLMAHDVSEGRKEVNFSTWNRRSTKDQIKALHESWEEVEEGEMPPWFYLPTHPGARLTPEDKGILKAWSQSMDGATLQ